MRTNHPSARLRNLLVAVLLFMAQHVGATVLLKGQGLDQPVTLARSVEFFLDRSKELTIENILAARSPIDFRSNEALSLRGDAGAVTWVRFSLQRESGAPNDWVVQLFPNWLDDVKVYVQNANGTRLLTELGDQHPFSGRTVKTSQLAFLAPVDEAPQTFYLRIQTHGPIPFGLNVWQQAGQEKEEMGRTVFYSIYAGGVGVMILMALVFWAWTRGAVHFLYALFLTTASLLIFSFQGYANSLLFPDDPIVADRFLDAMVCAFISSSTLFVGHLFSYRHYSAPAARLLWLTALFFAVCIPFCMLGMLLPFAWEIGFLGILMAAFNNVFLGWLILKRRAYQYVIPAVAFFLVNTSWVLYGAAQLGFLNLEYSAHLNLLTQISRIINLALINVAVASRWVQIELRLQSEGENSIRSMKMAEKAMEERTKQREFVAVISHEFRTPLAIVSAVSHALEVSPSGKDERVKSGMAKIRKAVNRLTIIIENILLDDALEMNSERAKKEKFDLRDVMGDARATGLPEEDSRIDVTLVEGPLLFEGDRLRIEMALRNIIQNALKYSPPASAIDLQCQVVENVFSVDVSNSGSPIPEGERSTLFERYFRGAHSSRIPGSGLGLHISRAIARQHGGDVVLISSDMERTTFRLSLPLKIHRSGAASSPSTPAASSW